MDRLLSSVYALNTSQTKKAVISLEYNNDLQQFVPKLRLTGHDSTGVPFDSSDWDEFKTVFGDITSFFGSYNPRIFGQRIKVGRHAINLTTSHSDRAIEISEVHDEVDSSKGQKKKYVHSVVYKLTTFLNLKKFVKCIDNKFNVLKNIVTHLDVLLDEFVKKLFIEIQHPQESQYFMMTSNIIEAADIHLKDDDVEKMKNFLSVERKIDFSCDEILSILYEFLCIKPDYLAYKYNICFDNASKMNT